MALHCFSMGEPTPFGQLPEGAALVLGAATQALVISLHRPTAPEVGALRRGRLTVGLAGPVEPGGAVLIAWRFEPLTPASRGLWFDSPFHIGRNPPAERFLAARAPHQHRTLLIIIQDEAARFYGGRVVTLSPAFCAILEEAIAAQLRAAQAPSWDYVGAVQKVLTRWAGPEAALRDAAVAEIAGRARWTGTMENSGLPVS